MAIARIDGGATALLLPGDSYNHRRTRRHPRRRDAHPGE
jgi:hypothetical protein